MKKFLITGMNKLQCTEDGFFNQQLKVVPSHYALIRGLKDMGYDVEQRVVEIGESLDEYDEVLVYLHNPSGFAGFLYNGLYAISARPDCIMAFDDWQTEAIYKGLLSLKDESKLFRDYVKNQHKNIPSDIENHKNSLLSAIDQIESKKNRMLLSAFSGGDLSLIIDYPEDRLFGFNPNPYHLNRKPRKGGLFESESKERIFNFAGLIQDKTKKWLKHQEIDSTDWPLKCYGSRKDKQDRVQESEMVDIFSQQWGILMAGYSHAGSGWWRARPLQVADAGSILIGEPKEMMIYYQNETLANLKASDLPKYADDELAIIAENQKRAIYKHHPLDQNVMLSELKSVLEADK